MSPLGLFSYDTVILVLAGVWPDGLRALLRDYAVTYDAEGNGTETGWLGPAWVKAGALGLAVRVSLPHYLFGTNAWPLPLWAVRAVVDRVGIDLGLGAGVMLAARAYRTDLFVNVALHHAVGRYVSALLDVPRADRLPFENGAAFVNTRRQLAFYDKVREVEHKKGRVPDGLAGENVLRYELRLKRDLARQVGRAVYAGDLGDPALFRALVEEATARFDTVQTARGVVVPTLTGPSALTGWLAAEGLRAVGLDRVLAAVDADRAAGRVGSVAASRVRSTARGIARSAAATAEDDLVRELAGGVHGAAARTLVQLP